MRNKIDRKKDMIELFINFFSFFNCSNNLRRNYGTSIWKQSRNYNRFVLFFHCKISFNIIWPFLFAWKTKIYRAGVYQKVSFKFRKLKGPRDFENWKKKIVKNRKFRLFFHTEIFFRRFRKSKKKTENCKFLRLQKILSKISTINII